MHGEIFNFIEMNWNAGFSNSNFTEKSTHFNRKKSPLSNKKSWILWKNDVFTQENHAFKIPAAGKVPIFWQLDTKFADFQQNNKIFVGKKQNKQH